MNWACHIRTSLSTLPPPYRTLSFNPSSAVRMLGFGSKFCSSLIQPVKLAMTESADKRPTVSQHGKPRCLLSYVYHGIAAKQPSHTFRSAQHGLRLLVRSPVWLSTKFWAAMALGRKENQALNAWGAFVRCPCAAVQVSPPGSPRPPVAGKSTGAC
jgi:hypothetical protein